MNIGEGAAATRLFDNQHHTISNFSRGPYIAANSMTFVDGKYYSISEYDVFRDGKGIEVHTTQFDDYINLTGLYRR